jgi:hypothetical protein
MVLKKLLMFSTLPRSLPFSLIVSQHAVLDRSSGGRSCCPDGPNLGGTSRKELHLHCAGWLWTSFPNNGT